MKGLELANMKKVAEDKKSATFKHKDGHEIKIAISKLSPENKKQLAKLPLYASEGADTENVDAEKPTLYDFDMGKRDDQPNMSQAISPEQEGTNPADVALKSAGVKPLPAQGSFVAPSDEAAPIKESPMAEERPQESVAAQPAPMVQPQPQAVAPAPRMPATPQEHAVAVKQDLSQEAQAWQNDLNNGHIQPETYQDLFNKKDTLGKIGTIFGLLVGGAGAGLSHQPNALLGMMNKEIENDLNAQMKSKDNAVNYIRLNQQHQMNQAQIKAINQDTNIKAYSLARMQMNIGATHKMAQMVQSIPATLPDGRPNPARANAENAFAMMYSGMTSENSNIEDKAAAASALFNFGGGGGKQTEQQFQQNNKVLRLSGNEKIAENRERKHVPGFEGEASRDVEKGDHETIRAMDDFNETVQKVREFAKQHSGIKSQLNLSDQNYGRTLLMGLKSRYQDLQGMGTLKGFDIPILNEELGKNLVSVANSITNDPKLRAAQDLNNSKIGAMKRSYGFPESSGKPPLEMRTKSGRIGLYDPDTKKPIGWKKP